MQPRFMPTLSMRSAWMASKIYLNICMVQWFEHTTEPTTRIKFTNSHELLILCTHLSIYEFHFSRMLIMFGSYNDFSFITDSIYGIANTGVLELPKRKKMKMSTEKTAGETTDMLMTAVTDFSITLNHIR